MMNLTYSFGFKHYIYDHIYSKIGYSFYLVDPKKTMFEEVSKVPRYVEGVWF